jgi:hypothetical protein
MFYSPIRVSKDATTGEQPAKYFLASMSPIDINDINKQQFIHFNLFTLPVANTLAMWYNRNHGFEKKPGWELRLPLHQTFVTNPPG